VAGQCFACLYGNVCQNSLNLWLLCLTFKSQMKHLCLKRIWWNTFLNFVKYMIKSHRNSMSESISRKVILLYSLLNITIFWQIIAVFGKYFHKLSLTYLLQLAVPSSIVFGFMIFLNIANITFSIFLARKTYPNESEAGSWRIYLFLGCISLVMTLVNFLVLSFCLYGFNMDLHT